MAEKTLQSQLAERLKALDAQKLSPPIEIAVGDYAFYPYRGFADIAQREDFQKLSQNQLRTLLKIADDILAMQHTELFEAFVNDDGIIVIDKAQQHVEYSLDIEYNDARTRIEEVYPQVTYPQAVKKDAAKKVVRVQDKFVRNDTAHEVAHHVDFWLKMDAKKRHLDYLHSSSTLLAWLETLDKVLRPKGVADLVTQVREAEGYVAEVLLEDGYAPKKVDEMLRAEFFAIVGEFYYGSPQRFSDRSPLLEAYMSMVLSTDLQLQRLYIPFKIMESRRGELRDAIHAPVDTILGEDAAAFYVLREQFGKARKHNDKLAIAEQIEDIVIRAIHTLINTIRKKIKLEPLA